MAVVITHLAFSIVAKFFVALAALGLFIIFFNPINTVGVFCTILLFGELPALPAAAARTLRLESSSVSASKPVDASDLIVSLSVAVAREFTANGVSTA